MPTSVIGHHAGARRELPRGRPPRTGSPPLRSPGSSSPYSSSSGGWWTRERSASPPWPGCVRRTFLRLPHRCPQRTRPGALLKACDGPEFEERRDAAIVRVFLDTGARLAEVAGIGLEDVDLDDQSIRVLGKDRRERFLPIGARTLKALDRYFRVRVRHAHASEPWLWRAQGTNDRERARSDDRASSASGRDRPRQPVRVPAHVLPPAALGGRERGRSHADHRMEEPSHGESLRSFSGRPAGAGSS
jgi:hypothetical protein